MRIIPNQGICDPHLRVYEGKVYMYASHDRSPENTGYYMDDWLIFSTDDMLNWKLEYTFHPEDTFLGKCNECYATDSAYRNGKYYLYFSYQQKCVGVAVSDHPAGPYKDALGKPLLTYWMADTPSYDPSVFIDDDEAQTPYLVWGFTCEGKQYYMARLNDDMISLAEPPCPVEIINSWDGNDAPALNKWNGKYYLSSHRSFYSTSDNVYGPYTYRGTFCTEAYTDHGNFVTFHNQTYFAYGIPENWGEEHVNRHYRTTKMVYAHFDDDGNIYTDEFIKTAGVGQYEATWPCIKGEWYFAASDGVCKKKNADGFEMRGIKDGSYLYYQNVNGMRQNAKMYIRGRCESAPCEIEIREGSPFGALLGYVQVQPQASEQEIPCTLCNTHGTHNLCFVFHGKGEELFAFDEIRFEQIKP